MTSLPAIRAALLTAALWQGTRGVALASGGPPPMLNPYEQVSPSSAYALSVNPSDLHGRGPADYRFAKNGVTAWTNRFDFTLWGCAVADSGHVVGYAYSHGMSGFSEGGYSAGAGFFSAVILSPSGRVVLHDRMPRDWSRFSGRAPGPLAEGVIVVEAERLAVIRVSDRDINRGVEQWWAYDLENGERTATLEPVTRMEEKGGRLWVLAAEAVPSTPLILAHWWKYAEKRSGGVFTLVDRTAKPVWSLALDQDYTVPEDENRQDEIRQMIQERGGILSVTANGTFDLLHVKAGQRVSYAVEPQPDNAWRVRETGRVAFAWPKTPVPEAMPEYPDFPLKQVGVFSLAGKSEAKALPLRDLCAFDFDAEGRICALRLSQGEPPVLILLTQSGEVLNEMSLRVGALPASPQIAGPAHVGGSRFIASVSGSGVGDMARFFLADFDAESAQELVATNCPSVKQLAGFPDGRFVALTDRNLKFSSEEGLFCFDRAGRQLWAREESGYRGRPEDLLSPEDVARCGTNSFAVIDNIRHTIQVFDMRGKLARVIELRKVWGREPSYPIGLAADLDAGFLLYDFNAREYFLRLDARGAIRYAGVPRLADGRPISVRRGFACSPQGAVWTCDGDALLQLTTNAVASRVLGVAPAQDVLYEAECAAVGPEDRVYVADRKSHVTHVFDASGKALGICVPKTEDLTENTRIGHIAAAPDRQVFLKMEVCGGGYLRFDARFKRAGVAMNGIDPISQEWYFQPSNGLCWVVGYNHVYLVKGERQEVVRRLSRRADGRWLEYPGSAGVAPDGALAVASRSQPRTSSINLYSPSGEPLSTFEVPWKGYVGTVAYDGRHVFVLAGDGVLIFKPDGAVVGKARLPQVSREGSWAGPYVAAGGRELWLVELESLRAFRLEAP